MASDPMPPSSAADLPPEIPSTADDRNMAVLCHLGGIVGFLVPLIIWLIKKDQSRFVDDQGKEALNFQLTILIAHLVSGATVCFTFGALNLAIWILTIVYAILAMSAVQKGEVYRYPLCIRMIQ
jgi:uncharacterized Tic20 family protein